VGKPSSFKSSVYSIISKISLSHLSIRVVNIEWCRLVCRTLGVKCIKEGTIQCHLDVIRRNFGTTVHLCIVKSHTSKIWDLLLCSILFKICIKSTFNTIFNLGLNLINDLRND